MAHVLTHLRWLTDDFGVWQHTKGDEIHWEMGYALDDAARGLIVFLEFGDRKRAKICLDYVINAQTPQGFIGFYDEHRRPLDQQSSHDAHALAIWALAIAVEHDFYADEARQALAKTNVVEQLKKGYLRTLAYLLLAYCALGDKTQATKVQKMLMQHYIPELGWFEDRLTYANAAIPLALLRYKRTFGGNAATDAKLRKSLDTLEEYSRIGVIPAPVGNRIWQRVGAVERDIYGQQPIDAGFMVLALVETYQAFGDQAYLAQAEDWMGWFHGNNIYKASLINDRHACADGLYALPRGVCDNKGAESTIVYLLALHALESAKQRTHRKAAEHEDITARHERRI